MRVIVSGYRRCGTSAMMHALVKGLADQHYIVAFSPDVSASHLNKELDGYRPNPGDLWEIGANAYRDPEVLRGFPDDLLVKIFYDGLCCLPKNDYLIVFMERDPEEVTKSLEIAQAHNRRVGVPKPPKTYCTFDIYRDDRYPHDDIEHVLGIMDARSDVQVERVNYRDLIESPGDVFFRIKYRPIGHERLPLNIEKAKSVIKKEHWRVRNVNRQSRDDRRSAGGGDRASA